MTSPKTPNLTKDPIEDYLEQDAPDTTGHISEYLLPLHPNMIIEAV
jgi:hypothetical protein